MSYTALPVEGMATSNSECDVNLYSSPVWYDADIWHPWRQALFYDVSSFPRSFLIEMNNLLCHSESASENPSLSKSQGHENNPQLPLLLRGVRGQYVPLKVSFFILVSTNRKDNKSDT